MELHLTQTATRTITIWFPPVFSVMRVNGWFHLFHCLLDGVIKHVHEVLVHPKA